jgi:hypothetical protein
MRYTIIAMMMIYQAAMPAFGQDLLTLCGQERFAAQNLPACMALLKVAPEPSLVLPDPSPELARQPRIVPMYVPTPAETAQHADVAQIGVRADAH